jgi:hypothetical protein
MKSSIARVRIVPSAVTVKQPADLAQACSGFGTTLTISVARHGTGVRSKLIAFVRDHFRKWHFSDMTMSAYVTLLGLKPTSRRRLESVEIDPSATSMSCLRDLTPAFPSMLV